MDLNNIEQLLTKYLDGNTSISEEQQLKRFFNTKTVPSHLESYKPLFNYFLASQKDTFTAQLPLKSKTNIKYKWLSIAAVAVISFGMYFNWPTSQQDLGTFNENQTQLAYNQFVQSLQMVSKNFNKGTTSVSYLQELNVAKEQIGYLNEMQNPIGRIIQINN